MKKIVLDVREVIKQLGINVDVEKIIKGGGKAAS